MKIGSYTNATIGGKKVSLSNSLYQVWKASPQEFTLEGVDGVFTKITKKSTSVPSKMQKCKWFHYADGTDFEVLEGEDYQPTKEIESLCFRSIRTWFIIE